MTGDGAPPLCDTHVHVFAPQRFGYATPRQFTPGTADVEQLRAHLDSVGAQRVVLVQPSVYGHDHRCLLAALQALQGQGRAVAVPAPDADVATLAHMDAAGVCGARINLVVDRNHDADAAAYRLNMLIRQLPSHWHIQLHVALPMLVALRGLMERSGRHFSVDHMGLPDAQALHGAPAQVLTALVAHGVVTVKLSAPYLTPVPQETLRDWVQQLAHAHDHGVVWGTNWPHTQGTARVAGGWAQVEPFRTVDDAAWLRTCMHWLAEAGVTPEQVARNVQRLYGV